MPGERQADLERLLKQQNRSSAQNRQDLDAGTAHPCSNRLSAERQHLRPCRKAEVQQTSQRPASSLLQALQQDKLPSSTPQKAQPARPNSRTCHHHQDRRPRLAAVCGSEPHCTCPITNLHLPHHEVQARLEADLESEDGSGRPGAHAHMPEQQSAQQVNVNPGTQAKAGHPWHSHAGHSMDIGHQLSGGPVPSASAASSSVKHLRQHHQATSAEATRNTPALSRSLPYPSRKATAASSNQTFLSRSTLRAHRDPQLQWQQRPTRSGRQTRQGAKPKQLGFLSHASRQVSSNRTNDKKQCQGNT